MNEERWNVRAGQPTDYPGCWIVSGSNADSGKSWSFLRKEDGTFWEILLEDYFPRSGGTLRVELGNQITNETVLAQLREYYAEWLQANFRVEVFDCPERGFRNFPDRQSAKQYQDSIIKSGVKEVNIRIVEINKDETAL